MPPTDDIMDHSDHFLPNLYELYPNGNFISQNHLGSPLNNPCDLAAYDPFPKMKVLQPHYYQNNSFYAATYPPTTIPVHDKQSSRPLSHTSQVWSSCSPVVPINIPLTSQTPPMFSPSQTGELPPIDPDAPFVPNNGVNPDRKGDLLSPLNGFRLQILSSPDSPAASPYLPLFDDPWIASPASVTTDTDDESSLASSISSLSPDRFDLNTFLGEMPGEDEDYEDFYFCSPVSPRSESLYRPLEQYPLRTSPHSNHDEPFIAAPHLDDDDLSPLTFSPPGISSLRLLSLSESERQPTPALNIKKPPTHNPPLPPQSEYHSFFDYDPSTPLPCSPSLRRSATLPELEPTTLDADPFGLHNPLQTEAEAEALTSLPPSLRDVDMGMPDIRSLPGCETDDDLIPMELASKNYISDPSAIVPTTSTGVRSLLLWDHNHNHIRDRNDIPTPRSPSPENFYLDPTVLAECADEEMQKVYELRQRTAKSEKWERERCRELSALLRLKLDERGVLGGGEGGDCDNHQSGSHSLPSCSNLSVYSSPSSNSPMAYHPQPRISSSFSSSPSPLSSSTQDPMLIPTSSTPSSTLPSTSGKPEARSPGPKHKIRSMSQLVASMLFYRQRDDLRRHLSGKARFEPTSSHYCPHPSSTGGAGMKVLPTPRSRLSTVILPEELELDSEEEGQGAGKEVESGYEDEEKDEDMNVDVDDRPLSRSCMDMDLDERGCGNDSHTVTWAAPP